MRRKEKAIAKFISVSFGIVLLWDLLPVFNSVMILTSIIAITLCVLEFIAANIEEGEHE